MNLDENISFSLLQIIVSENIPLPNVKRSFESSLEMEGFGKSDNWEGHLLCDINNSLQSTRFNKVIHITKYTNKKNI